MKIEIRRIQFFAAFLLCGAGLTALADPGTVVYEYDDAGRLRGATATTSDTRTATYTYDAAGNRTQTTMTAVPTLQFSSATYTAGEAGGTVAIAVVRSGDTGGAVSIQYSTSNGTAVAGSDYTAASGTLSWASGDTAAKTISVAITNDTIHESSEQFTLALSTPGGGAVIGMRNQATVTISDNDSTPTFSINDPTVSESGGSLTFTVTKNGGTAFTHAVSYVTANGTATAGSDYTAASGTLSFAPNDTSKTFAVSIANDTVYEGPSETLTANLSSPTNGATIADASGTGTITENDPAAAFSIANVSVNEGTATATFTVTKSGSTALTHAVNYATANGTATAGSDYTAASGTLSFTSATSTRTFTVSITNDSVYEGNEAFTANLSAPTNGATLGTSSATGTIVENDTAPSFSIANVSVNEGTATATFTVTKSGSTALTHAVNYATANGTATAGSDYTAASGTLSFTSATTTQTFTVSITNDTVYEGNEAFAANLSAPTNGATLGTSSATGTIVENDTAPSFSIANVSVNEGTATATFTVTKSGSTALTHAVNYATEIPRLFVTRSSGAMMHVEVCYGEESIQPRVQA